MEHEEIMFNKKRFEYAVRVLTLRGYNITVRRNNFYITKNGLSNIADTENKVILLANGFKQNI